MVKKLDRKFWFLGLILILALSIAGCSSETPEEDPEKSPPAADEESGKDSSEDEPSDESKDKANEETGDEEDTESDNLAPGVAQKDRFEEGIYEIGVDIPYGQYKYYSIEEIRSGSFRIAPNSKVDKSELTDTGRTDSFAYFELPKDSKGSFLELSKTYAVPVEKAIPFDGKAPYQSAEYKIGFDIPAGEYKIYSEDGKGFFKLGKDGQNTTASTIINGNFKNFAYIETFDGQFLTLSRAYALPIKDAEPHDPKDGYEDAEYKIGFDIPAGEYTIVRESSEDTAFIDVYDSSAKQSENHIVDENFETPAHKITLKDGYILKLRYAFLE